MTSYVKQLQKSNKNFKFDPKMCNKVYYTELLLLLNNSNPEKELYNRIHQHVISKLNAKCEYTHLSDCTPDEFFYDGKKQILLGRFWDTIGCFYKCTDNFFAMAMTPYSIFKNDMFIRYVIDKPQIFINNSTNVELEDIFPVRILISDKHLIPSDKHKIMQDITELMYDTSNLSKPLIAVSDDNKEIIEALPKDSILKKLISESIPINHIISREMCILYYMNLYFYVVMNEDKTLKPFIFVSKYNKSKLRKMLNDKGVDHSNIQLLYNRNINGSRKRTGKSTSRQSC